MNIIQKSNSESFFLRFHQSSSFAEKIFRQSPVLDISNKGSIEIVVLQILHTGEGQLIAECVEKDFYAHK